MLARLVWDGKLNEDDAVSAVCRPPEMGEPRDDQLCGSPLERLCELAGRVCYDSLGTGRSSAEYHPNIIRDKFWSIYEHAHFTVSLPINNAWFLMEVLNKPDLYVDIVDGRLRVTANLRHVLEWDRGNNASRGAVNVMHGILWTHASRLASAICPPIEVPSYSRPFVDDSKLEEPTNDHERFLTMYMEGSRVWSHEMVRHRNNMSQRSGRYCDESETPYVIHPLTQAWLAETNQVDKLALMSSEAHAKAMYDTLVKQVQTMLEQKGVDRSTARKQARSAGRYYLGNGLQTAMIYTASVAKWRGIFELRLSKHADAEIRTIMAQALTEAKRSRWASSFADMNTLETDTGPVLNF